VQAGHIYARRRFRYCFALLADATWRSGDMSMLYMPLVARTSRAAAELNRQRASFCAVDRQRGDTTGGDRADGLSTEGAFAIVERFRAQADFRMPRH
jgi:hypothetical protein